MVGCDKFLPSVGTCRICKKKSNTMKYKYMVEQLEKVDFVDEEHGLLTIESIRRKCFMWNIF